MRSKKHYTNITILRCIICASVLLYHLNILKGGFLAVCTFFVISGYFTCISILKKDTSLIEHYKNKFIKIYIPLLITVMLTIIVVPLFKNIHWFNLKPETTSVIFGYNNFWQIKANQDYFARSTASPFIHLWYISILLQLELIFPLILKVCKKIKHKIIPTIFMFLLSVIGAIYFYKSSITNSIIFTYYNTLTRLFSYIFGITLGFIHTYYDKQLFKKDLIKNIIFYIYLILLIIMFILIKPSSNYYNLALILATIISCRLLDYGRTKQTNKTNIFDYISNISYEIYLIQYPVIFIFEYIEINKNQKIALIILITLLLSILLKKLLKTKKLKYIVVPIILLYGSYIYLKAEDYTKEMNDLKKQLEQNEKMMEQNNEKYSELLKAEQEKLNEELKSIEDDEEKLKETIKQLPISAVGDSVMVGASWNIKNIFPNSYIDAKVSRSMWKAVDVIEELKQKNVLGNPVILHLGTNGECSKSCKDQIMNLLKDKKVFWINTTNLSYVNKNIQSLASEYDNLEIIDWYNYSKDHKEYFYVDGIHLNPKGRKAYALMIYDAIYNNYLKENQIKKDNIIKEHEEKQNKKITFYGNDMLLNAYEYILNEYQESNFNIDNFTYESLIQNIKNNSKLTNKIVFIFDKTFNITEKEYQKLLKLLDKKEVYFIYSKKINNIIYFDETNYLMPDGIHLSLEGNKEIIKILKDNIK